MQPLTAMALWKASTRPQLSNQDIEISSDSESSESSQSSSSQTSEEDSDSFQKQQAFPQTEKILI